MPPESPDLDPIEMLWHELKHFLWTIVKPTTKEQLLEGITRFWKERMTAEKCTMYINHLKKVVPMVIQHQGLRALKTKRFFLRATMVPLGATFNKSHDQCNPISSLQKTPVNYFEVFILHVSLLIPNSLNCWLCLHVARKLKSVEQSEMEKKEMLSKYKLASYKFYMC